ncbi:MAG: ParA family partition ATPase [Pseudomonadota bacterium]|nr:ParA family partition ATPase [Pseudomonadota bacterium]
MPKVIAFLNQKGGTTKTTTATNVASALVTLHGASVLLVDLDPQGSATDWSAARGGDDGGPELVPVVAMGKTLPRDLPRVSSGYDYVVIDGTPSVSDLAVAAVKAADAVIIPVHPSAYDIWACEVLVDLIKERQEVTDGKPRAALMVARAIVGSIMERQASEALAGMDLPVLETRTHQRTAYVNTVSSGGSVIDLPASDKARQEIEALTLEIMEFVK